MSQPAPEPRKGMPDPELDEAEFRKRFKSPFQDPAFRPLEADLDRIAGAAWDGYINARKSPVTRKAGPEFADPAYDLSVNWIAAREAVLEALKRHEDPNGPRRFLIVNGSSRSEHSCPGEMSKSYRFAEMAQEILAGGRNTEVKILDLSRLTSEYGREIHPCKACFSTAAALCHWPCSCYPNYSLGQTHDWMNEIYPMWVEAHGVMIVTPVNWYMTSSPLKLMIDRLVCADGGNPDPTRTHGKNAKEAKQIELDGWDYPKHLAGRQFSIVVHGDVEGAENVRRALHDWMSFMDMCSAGPTAEIDRYVGYWKPYATNHEELDADHAIQVEVKNAARALLQAVEGDRLGKFLEGGAGLKSPRQK
jgi:multimeric flavodoxin WrbA